MAFEEAQTVAVDTAKTWPTSAATEGPDDNPSFRRRRTNEHAVRPGQWCHGCPDTAAGRRGGRKTASGHTERQPAGGGARRVSATPPGLHHPAFAVVGQAEATVADGRFSRTRGATGHAGGSTARRAHGRQAWRHDPDQGCRSDPQRGSRG